MPRLWTTPLARAGVVAFLVAAVVVAGDVERPPGQPSALRLAEHRVTLTGSTVVCPDVRGSGDTQTEVSVAAAPPTGSSPGRVVEMPLGGTAPPGVLLSAPDRASTQTTTTGHRVEVVVATGGLAAGLEAEEVLRTSSGVARGLAGVRCGPPTSDAWILGGSGAVGADDELYLVNVDAVPALVDLQLWGPHGPLSSPRAQGIVVAPYSRFGVPIGDIAPDQPVVLVHVIARSGRVAPALSVVVHGPTAAPVGTDFVPLAEPPAVSAVVTGFTIGDGARQLYVANPGGADAQVQIRVIGTDGAFVPAGGGSFTLSAGTIAVRNLTTIFAGSPGAVRVTSSVPVVVAGYIGRGDPQTGYRELAFTAAAPPLAGTALVTDVRVNGADKSVLLFTAPGSSARAIITPLGVGRPYALLVAGGHTQTLDLARLLPANVTEAAVAVDVTAGSGPLYVARELFEQGDFGPLITVLPLVSAPSTVVLPAVLDDPRVGLGG